MGPGTATMEASQNLVSVAKLNNINWNVWKFQMKVILMAKGLYEITSGKEKQPVDDEEKDTKWRLKDAKAQEALVTRMEEEPLSHVMQCETAQNMWEKLESIYDRKSSVSMHLLTEQFYNLKFENESVNSFISKITNLCARIKQQGEQIPEKMVITKILMTLPDRYKHFRSAWESVPSEEQDISKLTARLLIEEERIGKEEDTVALMTKSSQGNCYSCGKKGHFKNQCKKNVECFYCKKRGHLMKHCYYKKQKEHDSSKNGRDNNKSGKNCALVSVSNDIERQVDTDWYLDSGASQHMCKDKELFQDYKRLNKEKDIKIGDGSKLKAIGVGNVLLKTYNGKNFHDATLYDVLYVPDLTVNLFSQGSALDKGLSLVSNSDNAQFISRNNVVCAMAVRSGKLFKMLFQVNCDCITERTTNNCQPDHKQHNLCQIGGNEDESCSLAKDIHNLMWWHKTLAHQNLRHVKNVLERNNIEIKEDTSFCSSCVQGKHHRDPFPISTSRSNEICAIIHVDLCGPMEVSSLNGSRYLFLLKDDHSNYRTAYFLTNKYEVHNKLKEFIMHVKTQTGKSIKVIRSDNGKEFVNKEIKKLLQEHGIRHELTVAYTPQQNGRAEREFRTMGLSTIVKV